MSRVGLSDPETGSLIEKRRTTTVINNMDKTNEKGNSEEEARESMRWEDECHKMR